MNRIVLILPFYGKLPGYFPLYLESLRGKNFDVLFVSDLDVVVPQGIENVRILRLSFADVGRRIRERIEPTASLQDIRKLCDYKPMYGEIFREEIKAYDYWAFGDCDLIYGTALNALLDRILAQTPDIVSLRARWISGGFCLLRNSEKMRGLFRRADDWRGVVRVPTCCCFDECRSGEAFAALVAGKKSLEECRQEYGDGFAAVVWRSTDVKRFSEDLICESGLRHSQIAVRDGHVFLDAEEVPIFHYVGVKHRRYFSYPTKIPAARPLNYIVTDAGFFFASRMTGALRLVYWWRKAIAIAQSLRDNGLRHLVARCLPIAMRERIIRGGIL